MADNKQTPEPAGRDDVATTGDVNVSATSGTIEGELGFGGQWFDASGRDRKPRLPTPETGAVYDVDPQLKPTLEIGSSAPELRGKGARVKTVD